MKELNMVLSVTVHVDVNERYEAAEAYGDWLSKDQVDELKETEACFLIIRSINGITQLIPEG